MQHPRSVDVAAAAQLRERAQSLAKQYDLAASTSLLPPAGECIGHVTFLGKQAPDGPVLRELQATEAQLATLMGQLVWEHPSDETTPRPSPTTTKPSLPRTAWAKRRRKRMRGCARALSRCTASKSLRPGCG
jgi:hypothetical protein